MQKFNNIQEVWQALDSGKTVYWSNTSYKLYTSPANREYHLNHFTLKDGQVLSARCISNYFGSILDEKELPQLFCE